MKGQGGIRVGDRIKVQDVRISSKFRILKYRGKTPPWAVGPPANAFCGAESGQILANTAIRAIHRRNAFIRAELAPGTGVIWERKGLHLNSWPLFFWPLSSWPLPPWPLPPPPPLTLRTYTSESPVVQFACSSVQTWLRVAQRDLLFAEGSRVAGPTFTNFLQNSAKIGQIGALPPAWPLPCGWPPHIGPGSCTSPPGSPTSCSVPPRTFPSRGCACRSDIACICANSFFV